jgi:hypothetical protein
MKSVWIVGIGILLAALWNGAIACAESKPAPKAAAAKAAQKAPTTESNEAKDAPPPTSKGAVQGALAEVERDFHYHGKPVHPGLVRAFEGSMADSGFPIKVSLDIFPAFGSNEYFDDDVRVRDKKFIEIKDADGNGYFGYQWLGRMADGNHVLRAYANGGGSGVFQTLYFVRFSLGKGFNSEGQAYDQLLMTVTRWYPLGDRSRAEVKVSPDKVVISGGEGGGPVTLTPAK